MNKRYARPMSDEDADLLQEAAADVAYLTSRGESPTEAIAKVATAARFSEPKTRLLTYAYSNGLAAEKRGSAGGPFQRLAEFTLPDPNEIHRLVYGEPVKTGDTLPDSLWPDEAPGTSKTASVPEHFLPQGMATFETDPTDMDRDAVRALFGLEPKTAGSDEIDEDGKPVGHGLMLSHTRISIGLGSPCRNENDEADDDGGQTLQNFFRDKIGGPPEDLETALLRMLGAKKEAMIRANAAADDAFNRAKFTLDAFGSKIGHRHLEPRFKRAGLLSVNAYHPEIAALFGPYLDEVNGFLIKDAAHDSLDVSAHHPWVAEAAALRRNLETVAELTVTANEKSAEYEAVCLLYRNRDKIRKSADWSSFLAGSLTPEVGGAAKNLLVGRDQSSHKAQVRRDLLDDLDDRHHDLLLQDIGIKSMVNDFGTNDGILRGYGGSELLHGYNDLLRTAPGTMRNRAIARAMLQQYMTQGRMAPTEYKPALEMNKLDPRKDTIVRDKKKDKDSDDA